MGKKKINKCVLSHKTSTQLPLLDMIKFNHQIQTKFFKFNKKSPNIQNRKLQLMNDEEVRRSLY